MGFTKAATELCVTQVAMSRQIKALEEFVGVRLFERLNRAVRLTPEGERLQSIVTASLTQIATTVADLQSGNRDRSLVVGTTTAFSAYWLMPRLAKIRSAHPELDLRFAVDDKCVDLKSAGIDVSIRYGDGRWSGIDATYLCGSNVVPVCSRGYWRDRPQLSDPATLLDECLLDFDYVIDSSWSTWFRRQGVKTRTEPASIVIDAYTSMIQAVQNGQGIALLGSPLVNDMIASRLLIMPTNLPRQELPGAYYLATPQSARDRSLAHSLFCEWIISEFRVANAE